MILVTFESTRRNKTLKKFLMGLTLLWKLMLHSETAFVINQIDLRKKSQGTTRIKPQGTLKVSNNLNALVERKAPKIQLEPLSNQQIDMINDKIERLDRGNNSSSLPPNGNIRGKSIRIFIYQDH